MCSEKKMYHTFLLYRCSFNSKENLFYILNVMPKYAFQILWPNLDTYWYVLKKQYVWLKRQPWTAYEISVSCSCSLRLVKTSLSSQSTHVNEQKLRNHYKLQKPVSRSEWQIPLKMTLSFSLFAKIPSFFGFYLDDEKKLFLCHSCTSKTLESMY